MKIPLFVKATASPTMLTANVRNIMPMPENVPVTTIILNATPRSGVNKTDITRPHAPFLNMLTLLVRVTVLFTNNAKLTIPALVRIQVILTLVLPVRSLKRTPAVALMIILTGPVVNRQVVPLILLLPLPTTVRTAPTAANIPVITPAT